MKFSAPKQANPLLCFCEALTCIANLRITDFPNKGDERYTSYYEGELPYNSASIELTEAKGQTGFLRPRPAASPLRRTSACGAALLCSAGGSSQHTPAPEPQLLQIVWIPRHCRQASCVSILNLPPTHNPVPNTIPITCSSLLPGSQRKMLSPMWPTHCAMGTGIFLLRRVLAVEFPNALTTPLRPPLIRQPGPAPGSEAGLPHSTGLGTGGALSVSVSEGLSL